LEVFRVGRPCTICTQPQREAINTALAAGHPFRDVAAHYAVSKTALHRHWQAHVAAEPASAPVAPARVSGTRAPAIAKWGLWAAGVLGVLWLLGRAREASLGEV